MQTLPPTPRPLLAFGMASLVLGTIGLLLAIFPVLGIPISAVGLLCGIIGFARVASRGGIRLRWDLLGLAVSALALAINIALVFAPAGYLTNRIVPQLWHAPPDRPAVPPPQ